MQTPTLPVTFQAEGLEPITVDLAPALAELVAQRPDRLDKLVAGGSLFVHEIAHLLPERHRAAAMIGKISVQRSFNDDLGAFAVANRLKENRQALARHFRDIRHLEWDIRDIKRAIEAAEAGRITDDPEDTGMVCLPFSDHFASDVEELVEDWGYDQYVRTDPRPALDDAAAQTAWDRRYDAWKAETMLPFVYGTRAIPFRALDAKELLAAYHEDESDFLARTAERAIEHELDRHHEDAADHVKDQDAFFTRLSGWETTRRDPETCRLPETVEVDAELEAIVAAFNAAQTLVSYEVNARALVPLSPGTTKEDCLAALKRFLERKKQELDALNRSWEPVPAAAAA